MKSNIPDELSKERTELAEIRTKLAEERTHLAYIRTGFSIILAGIFLIGFFEQRFHYEFIGYVIILIGIVFLIYGLYSHKKCRGIFKETIKKVRKK